MSTKCYLCKKKISNTAVNKICCACLNNCHALCLPYITKYDSFYTAPSTDWLCSHCIQDNLPFNHFNDDDLFMDVVSEMWSTTSSANLREIDEKIFNPFDINSENTSNPLTDADPDVNFFGHIGSCPVNSEYYLEDTFNSKCQQLGLTSKNFSMVHINIRSIQRHLCEYELYLESLHIDFSLIGVTETWFSVTNHDLYAMNGYSLVENHRKSRRGGGVAFYIRNSIVYRQRTDLDVFNENIESKFIEIDKCSFDSSKHIVAGVIYRPPNTDMSAFMDFMDEIKCKISKENKECYFLADFFR